MADYAILKIRNEGSYASSMWRKAFSAAGKHLSIWIGDAAASIFEGKIQMKEYCDE